MSKNKKMNTTKVDKKKKKEELVETTPIDTKEFVIEEKAVEEAVSALVEDVKDSDGTNIPKEEENAPEEVKDEVVEEIVEEVPAPKLLVTSMPHGKIVIRSTSGKVLKVKTKEVRAAWVDVRGNDSQYLPII